MATAASPATSTSLRRAPLSCGRQRAMTTTPPTRRVRRCRVSEITHDPRLTSQRQKGRLCRRSITNSSPAEGAEVAGVSRSAGRRCAGCRDRLLSVAGGPVSPVLSDSALAVAMSLLFALVCSPPAAPFGRFGMDARMAGRGAWRSLVSALVWGTGVRVRISAPRSTKAPLRRGFRRLRGQHGSLQGHHRVTGSWTPRRRCSSASTARIGPQASKSGVYDGRGTTVNTRAMNCSNSNMKLRRKSSVPSFVTSPSSVMRPGVNWMYASGALI